MYALQYTRNVNIGQGSSSSCENQRSSNKKQNSTPSGFFNFVQCLNYIETSVLLKSELDIYLEEGVYRCQNEEENFQFDALAWWKANELKYKILSKIARDFVG